MAETALALAQKAATLFAERGFENARLEAELLLAGVLRVKRLQLYTQFDRPVAPAELERYRGFVRRRLKHEPLQYILGDVQFRGLRLRVDRRALIPRPETEVLVGVVLEHLQSARGGARALDLGTGSGAIALALLAEGGVQSAVGTDAWLDALALARENADALGLGARLELRHGDLWDCVHADERFAAIVSNPPYVDEADAGSLAPEVRDWEPAGALFAADRGLAVLERIVEGAAAHLEPGGLLAVELGLGQADVIAARITASGAFDAPRITMDLTDRPRIVSAVASRH